MLIARNFVLQRFRVFQQYRHKFAGLVGLDRGVSASNLRSGPVIGVVYAQLPLVDFVAERAVPLIRIQGPILAGITAENTYNKSLFTID